MSLELSGTTPAIKGVAGSVSAPAITGDDVDTGISFPSANTIKFSTGGVERMAITDSGITGISGGKILQVKYTQSTTSVTTTGSRTQLLTLSINLASASNPVFVIGMLHAGAQRNSNAFTMCSLYRGPTYAEDLGDTELARGFAGTYDAGTYTYDSYTLVALDEGNTSTTQTYALTFGKGSTGTTDASTDARYSLTLMEVAA